MGKPGNFYKGATSLATLLAILLTAPISASASPEEGKAIAHDNKLGNCLACHWMQQDDQLPGNIGPPLFGIKNWPQYKDDPENKLRAQIWDATKNNPNTMMPPFGKHGILTEEEIDKVVEFVLTL